MWKTRLWLGGAVSALFVLAIQVAPITWPRLMQLGLWFVIATLSVIWLLSWSNWARRILNGPRARKPMTITIIALLCAVAGAVAGPTIWLLLSANEQAAGDELDIKYQGDAAQVVTVHPDFVSHYQYPKPAHALFTGALLINCGDRNVTLKFHLFTLLYKKTGERSGVVVEGVWGEGTFENERWVESVNIPGKSSREGTLRFVLPDPQDMNDHLINWDDFDIEKMSIRAEDVITGEFVMMGVMGYPPAKPFADIK